jgi:glutamate dehydrogenase (NADP+)
MKASIEGRRVALSGSGNVAQFAAEKLLELGAVPVSLSDSTGTIYEPDGITIEGLHQVMKIKGARGSLSEYKCSGKGAR